MTTNVSLLIDTSSNYGREILRGVIRYTRIYGAWNLGVEALGSSELKIAHQWVPSGLIASIHSPEQEQDIITANLPTVLIDPPDKDVPAENRLTKVAVLRCRNLSVGSMAAHFFLSKSLKNHAFACCFPNLFWSQERRAGYISCLKQNKMKCDIYVNSEKEIRGRSFAFDRIAAWLDSLEKPVGIFTGNDTGGRKIIDACNRIGLHVPQDIAVLGVDNDDILCEVASPPLSSIAVNFSDAGYFAAKLLHRMLKLGKDECYSTTYYYDSIKPISRHSTETSTIRDRLVAKAVDYISLNAGIGISVLEVANHLGVSRRTLELRFKNVMSITIAEAILNEKMVKLKILLAQSNLPLSELADSCGFDSVSYMGKVFRKKENQTLLQFRQQSIFYASRPCEFSTSGEDDMHTPTEVSNNPRTTKPFNRSPKKKKPDKDKKTT